MLTQPPAGRGSNGAIQRDGTFQLSTYGKGNGARPGSHQVAVVAYEGTRVGPERGEGTLLVPKRYTSPATSGLTIEVKVGEENSPVLELTSE
ncbi:MAG TPA: hypothetical protein VF175_12460 [Lacipirellula sp.]